MSFPFLSLTAFPGLFCFFFPGLNFVFSILPNFPSPVIPLDPCPWVPGAPAAQGCSVLGSGIPRACSLIPADPAALGRSWKSHQSHGKPGGSAGWRWSHPSLLPGQDPVGMRPCGSSRELWEFPASLPPSRTAARERARGSRFPNSCGAGPWHSSPGCSSLSFPRNHSGMLGEGLGWDSRGFSSPAAQENPWMGEGLVVAAPSRESFALCHGLQGKRPQSLLEALENWECFEFGVYGAAAGGKGRALGSDWENWDNSWIKPSLPRGIPTHNTGNSRNNHSRSASPAAPWSGIWDVGIFPWVLFSLRLLPRSPRGP